MYNSNFSIAFPLVTIGFNSLPLNIQWKTLSRASPDWSQFRKAINPYTISRPINIRLRIANCFWPPQSTINYRNIGDPSHKQHFSIARIPNDFAVLNHCNHFRISHPKSENKSCSISAQLSLGVSIIAKLLYYYGRWR